MPLKCQTTHFLCEVIIGEIFGVNDWCHNQTERRLNSESWFSSSITITHVFRFKEYYSTFSQTHGIGHNDINFVFPYIFFRAVSFIIDRAWLMLIQNAKNSALLLKQNVVSISISFAKSYNRVYYLNKTLI